jgi:serine/threonine protein kinase
MIKNSQDIKEIFAEAIQKTTSEELIHYLDSVCRTDASLRSEIESLLASHQEAGKFLKGLLADHDPSQTTRLREQPGTVIGRYKLLEKIGEGGMAVVYMAQQEQPIRRKVALKIIKLGMDTKQVIARFEAERQALAIMDHPNIAKVLDAGATETGRPFFVMELVQGLSITEYCDQNGLSTKDRLALFIQVCHAVQHAHQQGIIHRDIKPSNVMVTMHDGNPIPKVIDFGIAKATNQRLTEKTLFTRYAHIIGTPAYMSPEQAELSDLEIDARSDIYSLGILLYELLTGAMPFSEEELREAGYVEMQRIIREEEPTKPSTKISTLGEILADVAKCRASTPDLLAKTVRGDLDWIVMKALEKERNRRYDTASALAIDIKRHMDMEPILARPPQAAYRLKKFLRRNQTQVALTLITTVFVVVLIAFLASWSHNQQQRMREDSARDKRALADVEYAFYIGDLAQALGQARALQSSRHVKQEVSLLIDDILARANEKVSTYTAQIESTPQDANNYILRAQCFDLLGDQEKARSDRAHYAAILEPDGSTGLRFGIAERLGSSINSPEYEWCPGLANDGLSLTFVRNLESAAKPYIATRATTHDQWNPAICIKGANTPERLSVFGTSIIPGMMTSDGLECYIWDVKPEGYGKSDIYVCTRETIDSPWTESTNLGLPVNSLYFEVTPSISPNGLELYFADYRAERARPGGHGNADLWVARRRTRKELWQKPENLGPQINSSARDCHVYISSDGLHLFFDSNRKGGRGDLDLYVARRATFKDVWGAPLNLGPCVNTPAPEVNPCLSSDGRTLFFNRAGDIWQTSVISIKRTTDPNGHKIVIEQ